MAGWPLTGGMVISHTPKGDFFIGCACLSQLSAVTFITLIPKSKVKTVGAPKGKLTEVSHEVAGVCSGRPLPQGDSIVVCDLEAHRLVSLAELVEPALALFDVAHPLVIDGVSGGIDALLLTLRVYTLYRSAYIPVIYRRDKWLQPGIYTIHQHFHGGDTSQGTGLLSPWVCVNQRLRSAEVLCRSSSSSLCRSSHNG